MMSATKRPRPTLLILGAALLVAAVAYLLMSRGGGTKTEIVTSDDGKLRLEIPERALPEGISVSDISAARITSEEFFGLADGETPSSDVLAYRLEPDGLVFNEPVDVRIATPLEGFSFDGFTVPALLHASADEEGRIQLDIPDDTQVAYRLADGEVDVSGGITHFSAVAVDRKFGLFTGSVSPDGGTYAVGDGFDFTVRLTDQEATYRTGSISGREEDKADVTVSVGIGTVSTFNGFGTHFLRTDGKLEPYETPRPSETVVARQPYVFTARLTCKEAGEDSPALVGGTSVRFTRQRDVPAHAGMRASVDRDVKSTNISFDGVPAYVCEGPPAGLEFEYVGGQAIEVGPGGEFIDKGYQQRGQPAP